MSLDGEQEAELNLLYSLPHGVGSDNALRRFLIAYFACAPISDADLEEALRRLIAVVTIRGDADVKNKFAANHAYINAIFASRLREKFSPRKSYVRLLYKRIIKKLERMQETNSLDAEVCYSACCALSDMLYERLCDAMIKPSSLGDDSVDISFYYRIFIDFDQRRHLVLRERVEQLSEGTTGLSCWEAAFAMADFMRWLASIMETSPYRRRANVLELGSGCGLAGLAAAKYLPPHVNSVTLTDVNPSVLAQLEENVRLNFGGVANAEAGAAVKVFVEHLDWRNYTLKQLPASMPDIVIGSDLVYDPGVIDPLCDLLLELLSTSRSGSFDGDNADDNNNTNESVAPVAFIACTLRNEATLQRFLDALAKRRLCVVRKYAFGDDIQHPTITLTENGGDHRPSSGAVYKALEEDSLLLAPALPPLFTTETMMLHTPTSPLATSPMMIIVYEIMHGCRKQQSFKPASSHNKEKVMLVNHSSVKTSSTLHSYLEHHLALIQCLEKNVHSPVGYY